MIPMGNRTQVLKAAKRCSLCFVCFGAVFATRTKGIIIALEYCPEDEHLNILMDSLASMLLLNSLRLQRKDVPLSLHRRMAPGNKTAPGLCHTTVKQASGRLCC